MRVLLIFNISNFHYFFCGSLDWNNILIFRDFGSPPVDSSIIRMFLAKFSTFLCKFQRLNSKILRDSRLIFCSIVLLILRESLKILELSLWNLHRNVENFARNILMMDESTGGEQNPWKSKYYFSPVIHKKVMKVWNIEYQENTHSQTLLLSCLSHLPISVDYQALDRLKIDWTCQILNLSSLLSTHFYYLRLVYSLSGFWVFLHSSWSSGNSTTWVFIFSHLLTLFASFCRFIRAVWFDFFTYSFVSNGSWL